MWYLYRVVSVFFSSCHLFSVIHGQTCSSEGNCRQIEFQSTYTLDGKRLKDHVISTNDVMHGDFCEMLCYREPNCVSYNLKKAAEYDGKFKCELNNSTFEGQKDKLEENSQYIYRGAKNACLKTPCRNNSTCQTGFTDKGYRCLCTVGFKGKHCDRDINECVRGTYQCSANATCKNIRGSYECICKPGYQGDGKSCDLSVSSCKEIYDKNISTESKAYPLLVDNQFLNVYCHMTVAGIGSEACGKGGWTLVMKINGHEPTFHYDSSLWGNKAIFNLSGGETAFDKHETKLPTYWNTSFSKVCLGMKSDGRQVKFIVINQQASSLFALIADGGYRATSMGRYKWKTLVGSQARLQYLCNKEGFNVNSDDTTHAKARIGILGNDRNDCGQCDSRIGFGTGGKHDDLNTCGNEFKTFGPGRHIKTMGYIFVQ